MANYDDEGPRLPPVQQRVINYLLSNGWRTELEGENVVRLLKGIRRVSVGLKITSFYTKTVDGMVGHVNIPTKKFQLIQEQV